MRQYERQIVIALLLVTALGGCATRNELYSSADHDEALSERWRNPDNGPIGIYYSDMYKERAEQSREEADAMVANDPVKSALWGIFFAWLFGGSADNEGQ